MNSAAHRGSHRELIDAVPAGGPAGKVDAIVVPASRAANHLAGAFRLAVDLDAELVLLCSKQATADAVAALAREWPAAKWTAVDLPDNYAHRELRFQTFVSPMLPRGLSDLSTKRNLGLLLARLVGWRSMLFLDDDIQGLDAEAVRLAAGALDRYAAVGFPVEHFPDNSVVCHANRRAGGDQNVFVSGSALLIDPARTGAFFPDVYNEDWFFLLEVLGRADRAVAECGTVRQLTYDPYANPERAAAEEFGDVLAEGLMGLLHAGRPWVEADAAYWDEVLECRGDLIADIRQALAADTAPAAALLAAELSRTALRAAELEQYVVRWQEDAAAWRERLARIPRVESMHPALRYLNLVDVRSHAVAGPLLRPADLRTTLGVRTRVAPTARLDVPYRQLQEGSWDRVERAGRIAAGCEIGEFCVIGLEVEIGEGSILDAYSRIEGGVTLGRNTMVIYRASVGARARVGDDTVLAGLICDRAVVGDRCRVFGDLIHKQLDPTGGWDAPASEECSPRLGDDVFVGWGATVLGGVEIGAGAYVCAGATVTRDVPAGMIASGVNVHTAPADWRGPLAASPHFRRTARERT